MKTVAKPKPRTLWAIMLPDGYMPYYFIGFFKRGSIEKVEKEDGRTWKKLYALGFRSVRVKVTPMRKGLK